MTDRPSPMAPVMAGNTCVGHIYNRGKLGFEAYGADDKTLGTFADQGEAVAAILKVSTGR